MRFIRRTGDRADLDVTLVVGYAPQNPSSQEDEDGHRKCTKFWEAVSRLLAKLPRRTIAICMLDANGKVGYRADPSVLQHSECDFPPVGPIQPDRLDVNGGHLTDITQDNGMALANTYKHGGPTFDNGRGGRTRIDYILIEHRRLQDLANVTTFPEMAKVLRTTDAPGGADHILSPSS